MKPTHSILDGSFRYVPAMATSVSDTWSRFGWRPASRERAQRFSAALPATAQASAAGRVVDRAVALDVDLSMVFERS